MTKKSTENNIENTNGDENMAKSNDVKVTPKKRVKVDKTTEILFMNNTNGGFLYEDGKTNSSYRMTSYGDTDYITVDELIRMKNSHRGILEKFWILLLGVDSEDINLDDVLKYVGIEDICKNALSPEEVDNLLLKVSDEKFNKVFSNLNKNFKDRLVEKSVLLFKEKRFSNFYKIKLIQDYVGNDELFSTLENKEEK